MGWVAHATPELDRESRWRAILATTVIFTVLMIGVVALRFWIRRRILHKEDWLTLATMFVSVIYSAAVILQTRYGLGLPVDRQPPQNWRNYMLSNYASRPFYIFGLAGFKLALCISYLRMTKGSTDHKYRRFIIAVAVFSTFAHLVFVMLYLCQCVPITKMFDRAIIGECLPFAPLNYSISVVVIICDVTIFLLPIPLIQRLHLERAVKLGLTIVFALGLLTTVLSIMRASQIHRIAYEDGDTSYFEIRSGLELNIGIITSCLPVLRPVLRLVPRKIISMLPFASTGNAQETSSHGGLELCGDYPATQTIGGSYRMQSQSGRSWRSHKSPHWFSKSKDQTISSATRELEELDDYDELPSRRASTIQVPHRTASRQSTTRPWEHRHSATRASLMSQDMSILSNNSDSASQAVIQGGGRQRWEQADGSGRWEGFGGVIKTVELDVTSVPATSSNMTGAGEFGRGLTRKDEWEETLPLPKPLRSRAASSVSNVGKENT
ncbi:hypothetical protein CB0940_05675 [Cercospora beticola]|uniref:Rhodopsin domain-containing protein n=1 Tax=Cercospora beticola TaxID=122368 RepID=A0A2G5HXW3_CERBT|nr:hypothetical protein CB0940_05675 [Cercospora beticola]PIA97404.1 hypothetical protein CB0940_05675 [Cercospora beticola]WPA98249.1 hypothetical protein RHO25_002861 [Cercospora beticola]CAK1359476.1 unnamed protein product [Cercospora beticola]